MSRTCRCASAEQRCGDHNYESEGSFRALSIYQACRMLTKKLLSLTTGEQRLGIPGGVNVQEFTGTSNHSLQGTESPVPRISGSLDRQARTVRYGQPECPAIGSVAFIIPAGLDFGEPWATGSSWTPDETGAERSGREHGAEQQANPTGDAGSIEHVGYCCQRRWLLRCGVLSAV